MHSQESDRIRQAEAYYANHDRFAPGEEEAIEAYKARRNAEVKAEASDVIEAEAKTGVKSPVLTEDSFVATGYCLAAATGAAALDLFHGDDADDARIAAAALAWCREAETRLDTDVFVQHPALCPLYEGILGGLSDAEELLGINPVDAIADVFVRSNPRQRPPLEASADVLAVVLAATSVGIALLPQFRDAVYADAWVRNVQAFIPTALDLAIQFDSDQGAAFVGAARDALVAGTFPFKR